VAEQLVYAFHAGTMVSFERAASHSASWFGGPLEQSLSGAQHGPKPLHHIATLALHQLGASARNFVSTIPLLYGLCYDSCDIRYRMVGSTKLELVEMSPSASLENWPYPNYPPLLPYVPLRLGGKRRCSYAWFADRFPNMPEPQPSELVVAVPPPASVGMSLWGSGDGDGVTIVFECDLQGGMIRSYNVTS
jgi:hypothetical protein